ncbi:MAG: hypothetical protein KGL39_50685, partial [Patescibacteria group bacterium]|nr:hypothetical protein [Patescibacteria group bacterium]
MKFAFSLAMLLMAVAALALPNPPAAVYHAVTVDTNGMLQGDTNLFTANGAALAAALNALPINTQLTAAQTNEVWVATAGTFPGNGSRALPYVVTNAAQFDALMNPATNTMTGFPTNYPPSNQIIPDNSVIHLAAGTYHTIFSQGNTYQFAAAGITMQNGWRIQGAGPDKTIVKVDNLPVSYTHQFVFGRYPFLSFNGWKNMSVEDLTIDFNMQNQTLPQCLGGIGLSGDNATIRNVKFVNWGTTVIGAEQFMGVLESYGGNFYGQVQTNSILNNALIDGCEIGAPANIIMSNGVTAFEILDGGFHGNTANTNAIPLDPGTYSVTNGWAVNAEIKNCITSTGISIDPGLATNGCPMFFNAISLGPFVSGERVHNNRLNNLFNGANGIYGEPGPYMNVTIEDNYLFNVGAAILQANLGSETFIRNLLVRNNVIRYAPSIGYAFGVKVSGDGAGVINGLSIIGNDIRPVTNSFTSYGLVVYNVTNTAVFNNHVEGNSYDAIFDTNTFIPAYFNNQNALNQTLNCLPSAGYFTPTNTLYLGTLTGPATNQFYPILSNPSNYISGVIATNSFDAINAALNATNALKSAMIASNYISGGVATNSFDAAGLASAATNTPVITRLGSNVVTSIIQGSNMNLSYSTNSSGIAVTVNSTATGGGTNYISAVDPTNFIVSAGTLYLNPTNIISTNGVPALTITNLYVKQLALGGDVLGNSYSLTGIQGINASGNEWLTGTLGVGGVATFTNNAVVKGTLQLPVIGSGTVSGWMGVNSSGSVVTNNPPAGVWSSMSLPDQTGSAPANTAGNTNFIASGGLSLMVASNTNRVGIFSPTAFSIYGINNASGLGGTLFGDYSYIGVNNSGTVGSVQPYLRLKGDGAYIDMLKSDGSTPIFHVDTNGIVSNGALYLGSLTGPATNQFDAAGLATASTNSIALTRLGTNVVTSVIQGSNMNLSYSTNSSGIAVTVNSTATGGGTNYISAVDPTNFIVSAGTLYLNPTN